MSQCFNPDCLNLFPNLSSNNFCIHCGKSLLLKDRFRAIRYLGEGGFGRTFVGVDLHRHNTPCVIKQFLPLQQGSGALQKSIDLFKQEAQLLKILGKYPQIPDLLASFKQDNKLYLVQEFIEGQDLLKELQQKGKFSESEVKTFLLEMLPVLDFIHQKNVIHRDIKPENIIRRNTPLDPLIYGNISNLVLIDFGVSKQIDTMTQLTRVGTPGYAPPEQLQGFPDVTSDLYSLAVTAIRLLTGCLRTDNTNMPEDELFNFRNFKWIWKEWLINNGLSIEQNLAAVLDQMLVTEIDHRFQSAKDVLSALNLTTKIINTVQKTPVLNNQNTSGQITLKTDNYDYTKLEQFLVVKKWKEADEETANIMLKIMGRESRGYLDSDDCQKFPSKELKIIDSLWVKYSNGHFGFSVQKDIWTSAKIGAKLGKLDWDTWKKFAELVDWKEKGYYVKKEKGLIWKTKTQEWQSGEWKSYSELSFNLRSCKGHLPRVVSVKWGAYHFLFSKL